MEPEKGGGITGKNNPMLSENSLPKIIRWYKGRCSFEIRNMKNAKCFGCANEVPGKESYYIISYIHLSPKPLLLIVLI
jgi:hypothetical protein